MPTPRQRAIDEAAEENNADLPWQTCARCGRSAVGLSRAEAAAGRGLRAIHGHMNGRPWCQGCLAVRVKLCDGPDTGPWRADRQLEDGRG